MRNVSGRLWNKPVGGQKTISKALAGVLVLLLVSGCQTKFRNGGGLPFPGSSGRGDERSSGVTGTAPTPHVASHTVDSAGIINSSYERDGAHLVFVDNTPGKNGNLVVFREGDAIDTFKAYVSADRGATWTSHTLTPGSSAFINVMGGVQDSVNHAFHLTWLDAASGDQYGRWIPNYVGGDIVGFLFDTVFWHFNSPGDTPGPREITEVIDGMGNHRLIFVGTERSTGSSGLYKISVTTPAAGLLPAQESDWCKVTDDTQVGTTDQLLLNSYSTADDPSSFMITVSSNLVGGATVPVVVVGGFPLDGKLLTWTVSPIAASTNFSIGAMQTRSTTFSGGAVANASLSLFNAPSGVALILYGESVNGLHLAALDTGGTWIADYYSQPSTSIGAVHAVIATDSDSKPAVLYADGSGNIKGTYFHDGSWLSAAQVAAVATPNAAWNISNVWSSSGQDRFGIYLDAGASTVTSFSSVYWQ